MLKGSNRVDGSKSERDAPEFELPRLMFALPHTFMNASCDRPGQKNVALCAILRETCGVGAQLDVADGINT